MAATGPDLQAPLIVIGAGRSGTTLLMRALRAHPRMSFHGETAFLAPRLWRETVENRFWFNWERQFSLNPSSASVSLRRLSARAQRALEMRAGALAAEHVARLLGVRSTARAWGYKELWNGSSSFNHSWSSYDHIFPRATWLHVVRNPFKHAQSSARWNVRPLTRSHLRELLVIWTDVQIKSRERWETGRYIRLRYEDMVADPQAALTPVLISVGLDWNPACGEVFSAPHFASSPSPFRAVETMQVAAADFARSIPRFMGQCEDLQYLESREMKIEEASAGIPKTPDLRVQ